jgi:tetratricopeptide (TPR) repeat protein
MNMIKRFNLAVTLSALLLCCDLAAADDIQDANALFKQGQSGKALDKLNSVLSAKPKDAQARFLKGLIFTEQNKTAEAIKIFTALTEDFPELPEPYNNLAVLYAGQGQYEKAKVALEMAIRTHPSYATAHENLGDIYAKMASQAYDRALQLDRSNASTATKLEMIKDLFGGNNHHAAVASRSASPTTIVTTPAVTAPPAAVVAAKPVVAVVAATPAPAKATQPEKPPANANSNASDEVLKTVHEWATAWSAKNSKKYLSFYGKEFHTPDGESRGAWEKHRQERIAAPKSIHVELNNIKVKLADSNHATVNFRQLYNASHLHTSSSKTLELTKSNDRWLIVEEHTGK